MVRSSIIDHIDHPALARNRKSDYNALLPLVLLTGEKFWCDWVLNKRRPAVADLLDLPRAGNHQSREI
jgi:hypothetical protein